MHPFLEHDGALAFAHRGGASVHPENTMPAFQYAADLGYTYLETDVHATADGVLVAFHDDSLDRVTDMSGRIRDLPWAEVRQARVHGSEPIPRFDELVDAFPSARFNIDCKHDSAYTSLVAAIRRHDLTDRCCVGSFSDRRLRRLRAEFDGELCTSIGPVEITRWRATGRAPNGAHCAQVPVHTGRVAVVTERSVARSVVPVIVWTIDDEAQMRSLLDLGVDGLMTDQPEVLKHVLIERGAWG